MWLVQAGDISLWGGGGGVGGAPVYLVWPQTSHGECFEVAGVSWRDFPGIPRQYISRL